MTPFWLKCHLLLNVALVTFSPVWSPAPKKGKLDEAASDVEAEEPATAEEASVDPGALCELLTSARSVARCTKEFGTMGLRPNEVEEKGARPSSPS